MAVFQSAREEFLATQQAAEELLIELANGKEINQSVLYRLDKLASACSRLCYGNGFESDLSENILASLLGVIIWMRWASRRISGVLLKKVRCGVRGET